jgi:hypothetical protein
MEQTENGRWESQGTGAVEALDGYTDMRDSGHSSKPAPRKNPAFRRLDKA